MITFSESEKKLAKLIEKALTSMTEPYTHIYQQMINDFKKNDIVIPIYGKL